MGRVMIDIRQPTCICPECDELAPLIDGEIVGPHGGCVGAGLSLREMYPELYARQDEVETPWVLLGVYGINGG